MKTPRSGRARENIAESDRLLLEHLDGVDFEIGPLDFFLIEFARLGDESRATFADEEFREVVREGVRIHVNPNERIRAAIAGTLRRTVGSMRGPGRKLASSVIAAVENTESGLEDVPAVVRAYTRALVGALESWTEAQVDPTPTLEAAEKAIAEWTAGTRSLAGLRGELQRLGNDAIPAIADLLLETPEVESRVGAALDLLAEIRHPVAARALAFAISEPLLDEVQEQRAFALASAEWPLARPFVLYHLRRHTHEDIPFRWLELLVHMRHVRAVECILEELAVHAPAAGSSEELETIIDLLDRSDDPGLEGKILRFMTNPAARPEALDLVEEWIGRSSRGFGVRQSLDRWDQGVPVLVRAETDFLDFVASTSGRSVQDAWSYWSDAYHEALGWQRYSLAPRTPFEARLDRDSVELVTSLAPTGRVDPDSIRPLVEDSRQRRLLEGDRPALRAVLESRPHDGTWAEATFRREVNGWFVRAAAAYDGGDVESSMRILEILNAIDREAPLPRMLAGVIEETRRTGAEET